MAGVQGMKDSAPDLVLKAIRHIDRVRCAPFGQKQNQYSYCFGFIDAIYSARLIDHDQFCLLHDLLRSAFNNSSPVPSSLNAGPVMPSWVAYERKAA